MAEGDDDPAPPALPRRLCVVQADDRSPDELGEQFELMERTRRRCEEDADCSYRRDYATDAHSTYWKKVRAMRDCVHDAEGCDACLYVDSDAVLNAPASAARRMLPHPSAHVGIVPDWARDRFNAGVFAVRTSEVGKRVMDEWLSLESARWRRRSGEEGGKAKWECVDERGEACQWAGVEYEQGSFNDRVLPRYEEAVHEASPFLYNNDVLNCDGRIKHFAGSYSNLFDQDGKQKAIRAYLDQCPE